MTKLIWAAVAAVILTGCGPSAFATKDDLEAAQIALSRNFCQGSASPECQFINSPVRLGTEVVRLPGRSAKFFRTSSQLTFTDGGQSTWIASANTLTDGASIPLFFIPIVGSPRNPSFINAAAVHDAHCGIGNEQGPDFHSRTWQDTHRMFYDALRVGGTSETKSKLMFAAVYLGGPRWNAPGRDLTGVSRQSMVSVLQQAIVFIRSSNPSIAEIESFIRRREPELRREITRLNDDPNPPITPTDPAPEDPVNEPPVTEPPVTTPPVTTPPVVDPPATNPTDAEPPVGLPPQTPVGTTPVTAPGNCDPTTDECV